MKVEWVCNHPSELMTEIDPVEKLATCTQCKGRFSIILMSRHLLNEANLPEEPPERKHWYFVTYIYCPTCKTRSLERDRIYGRKPILKATNRYIEEWCGCGHVEAES